MMGKVWMPGGGGGADLDAVTAGADDVMAGKVIVGPDGEPIAGTKPDRGAWVSSVGMNGKTTIPAGSHNGAGYVNGPAVTQRGAWAGSVGMNNRIAVPEGYHNGDGYVDGPAITTMGGPSITPQTYGQTIPLGEKYLTSDGWVAGVALPPADMLRKGYRFWIGDNYVDGTFQGYVDSPWVVLDNATYSDKVQNKGATNVYNPRGLSACGNHAGSPYLITFRDESSVSSQAPISNALCIARLNQIFDISAYNYLDIECIAESAHYSSVRLYVGVSNDPNLTNLSLAASDVNSTSNNEQKKICRVNISSLSGSYYIYFIFEWSRTYGGKNDAAGVIYTITLTNN